MLKIASFLNTFSCSTPALQRRLCALVGLLLLVGCADESVQFPQVSAIEKQQVLEKWQRSCALCHVDGNGGAPRVGDREAWKPRLAQSTSELLDHTINGLGRMPPLGYCMDCNEQDFLVMIEFMAGESK